jgi:hypothetical protein
MKIPQHFNYGKGWHQWGLMLALAVVWQTWANAAISYVRLSTPNPDPYFPWDFRGLRLLSGDQPMTYDMDLNQDGVTDYVFKTANFSFGGFSIAATGSNAVYAVPPPLGPYSYDAIPLQGGIVVSESLSGFASGAWVQSPVVGDYVIGATFTAAANIGTLGYFTGVDSAYTGLQFFIDGQVHYGWVRVGAPIVGFNGGWIYDFAYETTPNTPILAGQTNDTVTFEANVNGGNIFPPNRSPHGGTGSFTLESFVEGQRLTYHLELDPEFHPTGAGIFSWDAFVLGQPARLANLGRGYLTNIFTPFDFPDWPYGSDKRRIFYWEHTVRAFDGQVNVTTNQAAQLLRSRCFVNFKSPQYPFGEVRGEIFPTTPLNFAVTLSGTNEIPRNASTNRGQATFTLAGYHLSGLIGVDLALSVNSAGLYAPPFAMAGTRNRVCAFDTSRIEWEIDRDGRETRLFYPSSIALTDFQVFLLKHGGTFLNVTTPRYPNGEIGGRVLPVTNAVAR